MSAKKNIERVGEARLPRHDAPLKNVAPLTDVLSALEDRAELLGGDEVDPAAIEIGLKIKRARLAKKMSQDELAEKTGIKQSAISHIESGKGRDGPSYRVVREIVSALGLGLDLVPAAVAAGAALAVAGRTWDFVQKTNDAEPLRLVGETLRPDELRFLLASLLPEPARRELRDEIAALLKARAGKRSGEADLFCSYWSLDPGATGHLTAKQNLLVMSYGGRGAVKRVSRRSVASSDRVVVAPQRTKIEIFNTGDEPLGVATMALTPAAARYLSTGLTAA